MNKFADACKQEFGIKPIEDDKLILDGAVQFGAYIKTFKRLDQTTAWHQDFVDTMVKVKVDALRKRIIQKYGTHKEYFDRMRERSNQSRETYKRNCEAAGVETIELNSAIGEGNAGSKEA